VNIQEHPIAADVDSLDDDIQDLLIRRAVVTERRCDTAELRPAAQARSLRRLLTRHSGPMAPRAIVQIWAELTACAAPDVTLHTVNSEQAAAYRDLARVTFGSRIPLVVHGTPMAALHACADNPRDFGLVPLPEGEETALSWWTQLAVAGQPGTRVVAMLPFVINDGGPAYPPGYWLASLEQEETADDTTLMLLELNAELSRTKLVNLLKKSGFDAEILAASRRTASEAASFLLLGNRGFVGKADARLADFPRLAGDAVARLTLVGGYANPMDAKWAA